MKTTSCQECKYFEIKNLYGAKIYNCNKVKSKKTWIEDDWNPEFTSEAPHKYTPRCFLSCFKEEKENGRFGKSIQHNKEFKNKRNFDKRKVQPITTR